MSRGVVWEEVIIMLPSHVNFVLLSATVPNTLEFADWVGRTKQKNIYVISTEKRPVPLQHFLWKSNKLFPILDGSTGKWNSESFKNARMEGMTVKKLDQQKRGIFKKPSMKQAKSTWTVLINYLQKQELLPVVIFAFSKKVCEDWSDPNYIQLAPIRQYITKYIIGNNASLIFIYSDCFSFLYSLPVPTVCITWI